MTMQENPKNFYRTYLADDNMSPLNLRLVEEIYNLNPDSVFEFGSGTGKNLRKVNELINRCHCVGLDISFLNLTHAMVKNGSTFILGDERDLKHLARFDVAFTCSVLDHIQEPGPIIEQLKRIGKTVFLAETHDVVAPFYYAHDYASYGFKLLADFAWKSPEDGATYYIWSWSKHD